MAERTTSTWSNSAHDVMEPRQPNSVQGSRTHEQGSATASAFAACPKLAVKPKQSKSPLPEIAHLEAYRDFRRITDLLVEEITKIDVYLESDEVRDEGAEIVAEIEYLLEQLYICPWGQPECLKRTVVAIRSQINNTQWTRKHVDFLKEFFPFLRVRYLIDESTVRRCYQMLTAHGLDQFRGTMSAGPVLRKYRIEAYD